MRGERERKRKEKRSVLTGVAEDREQARKEEECNVHLNWKKKMKGWIGDLLDFFTFFEIL